MFAPANARSEVHAFINTLSTPTSSVHMLSFKKALFKAYGLENHPKRNDIFRIAWNRFNSGGYNGVLRNFDEMICLL